MNLRDILDRQLAKVVAHGLRLRDFTAVFGCTDHPELRTLLDELDRSQAYRGVYGVHNLRWVLFDPTQKNGVVSLSPRPPLALALSMVFDGNQNDALSGLIRCPNGRIREILAFCRGFDADTDVLGYLKQHETPAEYVFRDIGPLSPGAAREPDATRSEIEDAYAIQRRFELFYAGHSRLDPSALRKAFAHEFAGEGLPLPLTPFERRSDSEGAAIRRMIDIGKKLQNASIRLSHDPLVRRAAHAKGHGLVRARFEVVPSTYQFGLFAEATSYDAILRPSNAAGASQSDRTFDAHGLAIGVLVPPDRSIRGKFPRFVLPSEASEPTRQDFILMDHPVFAAPDVQRFSLWFESVCGALKEPSPARIAGLLALVLSTGGPKQARILLATAFSRLRHPFEATYHSTTPYLLGDQHVAKYSVEASDPRRFRQLGKAVGPNFLRTALAASLRDSPIQLRFYVHVLPNDQPLKDGLSLVDVVEDATVDWSRLGADKVHVANIQIGAQDPSTPERMKEAESARFSPWNALAEHRPLGSLNRARWAAYRASQADRASVSIGLAREPVSNAAE
jgi:hypothetical protein